MTGNLAIREMASEDPSPIAEAFRARGWNKPQCQFEKYYPEQEAGKRTVLIAEQDGKFVGYLAIGWNSHYPPFRDAGWVLNIGALSEHFRCVAVDTLGGPGRSKPNPAYARRFVQLDWQLEVLDALRLESTNLAGVSNGAYMAYNLCAKAPDRVRKAICIEGGIVTLSITCFSSWQTITDVLCTCTGSIRTWKKKESGSARSCCS